VNNLTITYNNKIYTDNSQDLLHNGDKEVVFVVSKQNKKYLSSVKQIDATIIESKDLIDHIDLKGIKIVGVTGTNGKTTVTAAIYSFLLDLGYKAALQGTRGFYINDEKIEPYTLTTPVQLSNFGHIIKAIENGCEYFVMEVSSHAIAQHRIEGLSFELKVHTNITQDHLDYHNTLQEYIDIKNSFFQDDTKKLINKDDKNIKFKLKNIFAYGAENPATYKVNAYSLKNGLHVALQHFSNIVSFSSPMLGYFNVYNLTCAIAATHLLTNKPLQEICDVVENFGGVAGRMEVVSNDPFVVVDFAHTPDGMKQVFISFADYEIITVFGAGGNRDRTKRPMMGKMATFYSKEVIITSDNPRFEDPDTICEDIIKGCKDANNYEIELNRSKAIEKAIKKAKNYKNSVVLILGKGDEEYQIIYDKKFPLNDKDIVNEAVCNSK
jgi:UDP-N-acetylmuramoyl-L-alanyl-D-glutamate--2,6-diaminopimelate ligase